MATLVLSHPDCVDHDAGPLHPESPSRLTAILDALEVPRFASLMRREAPLGQLDDIARLHPRAYAEALLAAVPASGRVMLDADTALSPGSGRAALRAVGAVTAAVDAVLTGVAANAFCAVRPPGHHAEPSRPMGFCLFNNVAIGALRARAVHGITRVAIVDFDVHHGNGTQTLAERVPEIFFGSTHEWPQYPGTGAADETGSGNVLNLPLPAGTGGAAYRRVVERELLPALDRFAPEFLMISAGFDAHRADPLADLCLVEDDYRWITARLMAMADTHGGGRIVSVLEGGYDLKALAASAATHVATLAGLD